MVVLDSILKCQNQGTIARTRFIVVLDFSATLKGLILLHQNILSQFKSRRKQTFLKSLFFQNPHDLTVVQNKESAVFETISSSTFCCHK